MEKKKKHGTGFGTDRGSREIKGATIYSFFPFKWEEEKITGIIAENLEQGSIYASHRQSAVCFSL